MAKSGLNLADGMKGRSEDDKEIAENKEQADVAEGDTDGDGFLSIGERELQLALQKNELVDEEDMPMKMSHGGMSMGNGVTGYDEVSGNPIPVGSTAENVRDDIDAKLSTGEFVLPANVVKWVGLKYIMDMQAEAEMGLMSMHMSGLIQNDQQEESGGEDTSDASVSDESDTGQEKTKEKSEAQEGDKIDCPECNGEGCEHCDGKGYHDAYTEASTVKVEDHLTDEEDAKISPKSKSLPSFYKKKKVIFAIQIWTPAKSDPESLFMNKKQKYSRAEEIENEMSYSEELATQQPVEELDAEEESYKKRYQDIQRHIQTVRDQSAQQVETVQKQLDAATRKQIKFPKTDQEIAAWSTKYPDVAQIVDSIAQKRANEVLAAGEERLKKVERFEKSLHKQSAEQQLLQKHPDFAKIREDKRFHDWVALQHPTMQDSVYKNNTDASWASSTIDLYKAQTGYRKGSKSAAESIGRSSSSAPATKSKATFSESMVQRMTDKEYEANEEAIDQAQRSGNFNYDITGAAR